MAKPESEPKTAPGWCAFAPIGLARNTFALTPAELKKAWPRLHRGDREPMPRHVDLLRGWGYFHRGNFERATDLGLRLAADGLSAGTTLANKATCVYASYLEPSERAKLELFQLVAQRAEAQQQADPDNANAYYFQAYAVGRYGQSVSVAKALAQGLGTRVMQSLERAIALQPKHADAHVALGAFHAEVIDKVGSLIAAITYGVRKDLSLKHFEAARQLNPGSAICMVEHANALVMLDGDLKMDSATQLYKRAARSKPRDAMEWLHVARAQTELAQDSEPDDGPR
jgi:tetratricopeptide (TPR) repeat protein